jgi:hypothetical protein
MGANVTFAATTTTYTLPKAVGDNETGHAATNDRPLRNNTLMSLDEPIIELKLGEAAFAKLREFGNSLKPGDENNNWFFQIVFELMDATLSNYQQLRTGYNERNFPLMAWACRNLLELAIFTKYVLISEAHARRFADDRLIDGCDIITALRTLELHVDPQSDTRLLDDALVRMQAQMAAEGVAAKRFLAISELADAVGMKQDFACMNRVCSKLVHPTAWSVLAVNKGENSFSQAGEIFFSAGVQYVCDLYLAVQEHNATHGMKPKPSL